MLRLFQRTRFTKILPVVVVLFMIPLTVQSQPPASHTTKEKVAVQPPAMQKQLESKMEVKYFQVPDMHLKDLIGLVQQIMEKKGTPVAIKIDFAAFEKQKLTTETIQRTVVTIPPTPTEITLGDALEIAAAAIPGKMATVVTKGDHILITVKTK